MACRKMNEDVAYARNTESGCNKREKKNSMKIVPSKERTQQWLKEIFNQLRAEPKRGTWVM